MNKQQPHSKTPVWTGSKPTQTYNNLIGAYAYGADSGVPYYSGDTGGSHVHHSSGWMGGDSGGGGGGGGDGGGGGGGGGGD